MTDTLNETQIRHVAQLARLKLADSDVQRLSKQISSILEYVAQLRETHVEGLEPMAHPLPLHSVLREDEITPSLTVQQVLANAPGKAGAFFTVPKVLDNGMGGG